MPDMLVLLEATAVAAIVGLVVGMLGSRKSSAPALVNFRLTLAVAAGLLLGSLVLKGLPNFPPTEDRDRLLLLLLPLVALAQLTSDLLARWPIAKWLCHGGVAFSSLPILLHGTNYLGSEPTKPVLVLAGIAALLWLYWSLMTPLAKHVPGWVGVSMVLSAFASGVAILLSGYMSAGLLGFVLGAGLAGVTLATWICKTDEYPVGIAIVGNFSLVAMGAYFGTLPIWVAATLLFAPLLLWTMELPGICRLPRAARVLASLVCVTVPLGGAVARSMQSFQQDSVQTSTAPEPSADDYLNFGR